jgi:hypothetical protein
MTDDIVPRLRVWSDWLDERCPDTAVMSDLREAADEIERLRKERDEARQWLCLVLAKPTSVMGLAVPGNGTKHDFAKEQGWDCFEEPKAK